MESLQNDPSTQEAFHSMGERYYCPKPWGLIISEFWELTQCVRCMLIHVFSLYCCCTSRVPGTEQGSTDARMRAWTPHLPLGAYILYGMDVDRCTEELTDSHESPKGQKKEGETEK